MTADLLTNLLSRRALLRAGLGAAALLAGAGRRAFAAQNPSLAPDDIQDLDRVSTYLNSITTATSEFTQFSDEGDMAEGVLYMSRPGRVRFEYTKPSTLPVIICDGTWVALDDRSLKSVSRYPLNATPLSILLRENVDLAGDTRIVGVERQPGVLSVTARDDKGIAQGELTLVFRDPGLELRNWVVKDAQGYYTTVAVRGLRQGVSLDPALFRVPDYGGGSGLQKH